MQTPQFGAFFISSKLFIIDEKGFQIILYFGIVLNDNLKYRDILKKY